MKLELSKYRHGRCRILVYSMCIKCILCDFDDIYLIVISFNYKLTEMDDNRGSGHGSENENPQMTELRDMVQLLVRAVTAQQALLQ